MNKIILTGRLTRDPEMRYSANNTAIATYTLAVNRPFRQNSEQQADFLRCVTFASTAQFAEKYLAKGMRVAVEGRIQTGTRKGRKSIRRTLWWNGRNFWRKEPITGSKALTTPTITMTDLWISRTGLTKDCHSINR